MIEPRVSVIHPDAIDFGERGREDYGDIQQLAQSIDEKGVIQPLAVMEISEPENGKEFLLLAGGRRLTAINHHNQSKPDSVIDQVPIRIYPCDLDAVTFREIELEENLQRKDLHWWERGKMMKALTELKQAKYGKGFATRTDLGQEKAGWSLGDTAQAVGVSKGLVHRDIQLAEAYERHPDVFSKCKSASEAAKVLTTMKKAVHREELARAVDAERSKEPQGLMKLKDNYILGDFFEGVKKIPDGSMNFIEIDPPYGMDLQTIKQRATAGNLDLEEYNEIPADEYPDFLARLFAECYRVAAPNSWLLCWFGPEPWFETIYQLLMKVGFKGNRLTGVWVKPNGQSQRPDRYLANATEHFFYVRKGDPSLATQGHLNHFIFNPVPGQKKVHPTERPLALIEELLDIFALPGAKVLTPFAGSGKTIVAAHNKRMTCVGFDLAKAYRDAYLVGLSKGEFL